MARKTATITITDEGRDQGKVYVITEMSARQAERWAARALLAIGRSGIEIPEHVASAGFAGIAAIGIRALAGVPWELAEPLMDEMFSCIAHIPDPSRPMVIRAQMIDDDVEEVATRLRLRDEVINLHVGFSIAASLSSLKEAAMLTGENTTTTSTSAEPSGQ